VLTRAVCVGGGGRGGGGRGRHGRSSTPGTELARADEDGGAAVQRHPGVGGGGEELP